VVENPLERAAEATLGIWDAGFKTPLQADVIVAFARNIMDDGLFNR
jgi:hypothetical protein